MFVKSRSAVRQNLSFSFPWKESRGTKGGEKIEKDVINSNGEEIRAGRKEMDR
jgi:hypothetical protein